jgi:hypothetical protein
VGGETVSSSNFSALKCAGPAFLLCAIGGTRTPNLLIRSHSIKESVYIRLFLAFATYPNR